MLIKGFNNKAYEVTMKGSRKIYEATIQLPQQQLPQQQLQQQQQPPHQFIQQQLPQQQLPQQQLPQQHLPQQQLSTGQYLTDYQQPGDNTSPNPKYYDNSQIPFYNNGQNIQVNSQQQLYTNALATTAANQAFVSSNAPYQLNSKQLPQQQQQLYQQQQFQQQQQQLQTNYLLSPQDQYQHYLQQPLSNTNLPNANTLLNDLVNNQNYVSQSQASQLDVYPYKQLNSNPRPYTRIITKCDNGGKCEPQNVAADGISGVDTDFLHQQVLKQSHAQIVHTGDKCQNEFNYQYTGHALVDNVAKAQRGIPIKKGTDLKNRRLIPYTEVVIPQYPHN